MDAFILELFVSCKKKQFFQSQPNKEQRRLKEMVVNELFMTLHIKHLRRDNVASKSRFSEKNTTNYVTFISCINSHILKQKK